MKTPEPYIDSDIITKTRFWMLIVGIIFAIVLGWWTAAYIGDKIIEYCDKSVTFELQGKGMQCIPVKKQNENLKGK